MNEDECVMAKLNSLIRKNNNIIRIDYALARVYSKCLVDFENSKTATDFRKKEKMDLESKIDIASNSIDILSKMIEETDANIKRVKREIDFSTEKGETLKNHLMTFVAAPSDDDETRVLQSHLSMALLDTFKYCEEIKSMGFDLSLHTQDNSLHPDPWSQFQME